MEISERVLILAPRGRDSAVAASILTPLGFTVAICQALGELVTDLEAGAGVALVAIEALQADPRPLAECVGRQPPWSDFPFVVVSHRSDTSEPKPALDRVQSLLGNVIFLDRPFHPSTLVNVVENALRARRRQYKAREYLRTLSATEARLRFLDALSNEVQASASADEILAVTTRMLGRHLGASSCAYADMQPDQDRFTIRGDWSAEGFPSIVGSYRLRDFGKLAVQRLGDGLPLVVHDNRAELAPEEAETFQRIGIAATICMPLVKNGRLTALMAVHDRQPRQWRPEELALMTEVTQRSWAHIERVRAQAAVREGEQRFLAELEAKVAERTRALQQSEKRVRSILETSHLYQGLLSVEGTLLYANATSLSGIAEKDVIGKPFWETPWFTGTPGAPELVREAVRRVARGETYRNELKLDLPAGVRQFDFSMRPVTDDEGRVVAIVPEAFDTTDRAKIALALQQAVKMEAIGNLTGGVAHDFNNLLMAIYGSLEMLRKRLQGDPGLLRLVDNALEGARRGSSLTQRMLAFARRQELKSERIDAHGLIDGMMELLQRSLGPMITLETNFPPGLPAVYSDPNQLESALVNLAVNARDAMNGAGRIVISARVEAVGSEWNGLAPGRYLCLSVADQGEGMDEETLKRATEPFFTTKGVGKGTGLGLSMVHGLAEQSGGTLLLRSAPGRGTTAEIWLPAEAAGELGDHVAGRSFAEASQAGNAEAVITSQPLSIMAVDDDALVLMNTVSMLEDLGHEVRYAFSGCEALEAIRQEPVDLVVTDHAMPKMTGAELAAALKVEMPDLPVILATGYAELPNGAGAGLPRLAKPFSQSDLAAMVRRAIGKAKGAARPRTTHRAR
jgi:PAS domain S-box-containing protein